MTVVAGDQGDTFLRIEGPALLNPFTLAPR
jgi:hypothetical protein